MYIFADIYPVCIQHSVLLPLKAEARCIFFMQQIRGAHLLAWEAGREPWIPCEKDDKRL